jgi:hypothetical protein
MKNKLFYLSSFFILLGLSALFYYNSKPSGAVKVYLVKNKALNLYEHKDLKKIYTLVKEKPEQAVNKLSSLPFVESAILSKSLSGQSKVEVSLQEPVFALASDDIFKLVNKEGEVFSEVPQYKLPNIPILSGRSFLVKKNRVQAIRTLQKMPEKGFVSRESLSEVLLEDDLSYFFSGVEGRVYMGEDEVKRRSLRLAKVIKYLRYHGLKTKVIDARFKDKVIVSLND